MASIIDLKRSLSDNWTITFELGSVVVLPLRGGAGQPISSTRPGTCLMRGTFAVETKPFKSTHERILIVLHRIDGVNVTRTIRLEKDLDSLIQKMAKDERMTVNGFVNQLLTRYAEWDRYSDSWGM